MSFQRSSSLTSSTGRPTSSSTSDPGRSTIIGSLKLNDSTVSRLQIAKRFTKNTDSVNALCFSDNGEKLLTSGEDDQMYLYDAVQVRVSNLIVLFRDQMLKGL